MWYGTALLNSPHCCLVAIFYASFYIFHFLPSSNFQTSSRLIIRQHLNILQNTVCCLLNHNFTNENTTISLNSLICSMLWKMMSSEMEADLDEIVFFLLFLFFTLCRHRKWINKLKEYFFQLAVPSVVAPTLC